MDGNWSGVAYGVLAVLTAIVGAVITAVKALWSQNQRQQQQLDACRDQHAECLKETAGLRGEIAVLRAKTDNTHDQIIEAKRAVEEIKQKAGNGGH